MKKVNSIEDSMFYKSNKKIYSNLWKIYTLGLVLSLIVIFVKGFE